MAKKPQKKPMKLADSFVFNLEPCTEEQRKEAAEKQRRATLANREALYEIADALEKGEPIPKGAKAHLAAGALRAFAKQIPTESRKPVGTPRKLPRGLATEWAIHVLNGSMSSTEAIDALADKYAVSDPSQVRAELRKQNYKFVLEVLRLLAEDSKGEN